MYEFEKFRATYHEEIRQFPPAHDRGIQRKRNHWLGAL